MYIRDALYLLHAFAFQLVPSLIIPAMLLQRDRALAAKINKEKNCRGKKPSKSDSSCAQFAVYAMNKNLPLCWRLRRGELNLIQYYCGKNSDWNLPLTRRQRKLRGDIGGPYIRYVLHKYHDSWSRLRSSAAKKWRSVRRSLSIGNSFQRPQSAWLSRFRGKAAN